MTYILMALLAVLLIFMFICMAKEKAIIGFYKAEGLFGRAYAYFFSDFLLVGIALIIMSIIGVNMIMDGALGVIIGILLGLVMIGISVLMFIRVSKKCPGELKKRLFWDMLVAGLGFSTRIALIFIIIFNHAWLEANKPTAYEVDGRIVYAYPGSNELYDSSGHKVGIANNDRTQATMY